MPVARLWLANFRSYESVELEFHPGTTAVIGENGAGKTNLVEAIHWLSSGASLRGAPNDALIRVGCESAVIRAELRDGERTTLVEAEIVASGRNRIQVNRNRVSRVRDLIGHLRTTVFSPDDLVMVKGGPGERRRYLDDLLVSLHRKHHGERTDLERVLRQRNTLLRQSGGRLTDEIAVTLDVWDTKLTAVGESIGEARRALVSNLEPELERIQGELAGGRRPVKIRYESTWEPGQLSEALAQGRAADVKRGVTQIGPHRDDVEILLDGQPARTHASQGEQRSLALAMRLAGHDVVHRATGAAPVLLLDDVFSELDPVRSAALLALLPAGQAIITTASPIDALVAADDVVTVESGRVAPKSGDS